MAFEPTGSLSYLLSWVKNFDFVKNDMKPEDLCDGIVISKILIVVSPSSFSSWQSRIKSGTNLTSFDKCSNLNLIVGGISEFFENVIGQPLAIFQLPNVSLIADAFDNGELLRLLQLVICCAVNGENKEDHIQAILNMEREVQQAIMESVQEVMNETSTKEDEISIMSKNDRDDAVARKCHELENKIAHLMTEKAATEAELEDALQKIALLSKSNAGDGVTSSTEIAGSVAATLQLQQLQEKLRGAQEELFQVDAEAQEAKVRLAESFKTIEDLRKANDALTRETIAAKQTRDELDVSREELLKAQRQISILESWKKRRVDETNALRVRCTKLEEDNAACLQALSELKQENRLNSSLRVNAEASRNQSAEASSRVSELELRTLQLEEELKQSRADLQSSLRENQVLLGEMRRLRDSCENNPLSSDYEPGDNLGNLRTSLNIPSNPIDSSDASNSKEVSNEGVFEVEQRYRGYLAKALEVIRQLDRRAIMAESNAANPSGEAKPADDSEIARLQALLADKDNIIEQLERHHEQARRQRDLEDRMMLTAWYHLGMRVNRAHTERLLHSEAYDKSVNDSFLSQQRKTHLNSPFRGAPRSDL